MLAGVLLQLLQARATRADHARGNLRVDLHEEGLRARERGLTAQRAEIVEGDGLIAEHTAFARTARALRRHDLAHAIGDVLTRHLDEAERADRDEVDLRTVLRQLLLEGGDDLIAIRLRLHIDEVNDDDAAEVAQT